ncbi:MAG: peptide-methionine (S)-S-oxide reductase MsrA [Gammaproteobacteria bacterium]|nr:peptide-methionine (S)-S-oxide reductase MsrA [Gammaproteobacteria bacterium]
MKLLFASFFMMLLNLLITPVFAATPTNLQNISSHNETAIFAGGCFWCMEPPFDKLDGVISTTSGYTSGHKKNPTYREVSAGTTGHTEAIEIIFNPAKVSYAELLEVFWKNIDPVAVNRQFCDAGTQYRSGIYPLNSAQEKAAKQSFNQLQKTKPFTEAIATEIVAASTFYPAEDYHQDYYQKNPLRYKFYRYSCGRDQRLSELWGN